MSKDKMEDEVIQILKDFILSQGDYIKSEEQAYDLSYHLVEVVNSGLELIKFIESIKKKGKEGADFVDFADIVKHIEYHALELSKIDY